MYILIYTQLVLYDYSNIFVNSFNIISFFKIIDHYIKNILR